MGLRIARLGVAVAFALAVSTGAADGRVRRPLWPAAMLTEKADVVVIARAVSVADSKAGDAAPKGHDGLIAVDTKFRVLAVLKGKVKGDTLTLLHFRGAGAAAGGQSPEMDGPSLVTFDPKAEGRPRHLLFLKARADGRDEPVSGQVDPDVSVSKLDGPADE
jgi:hypothetical protein